MFHEILPFRFFVDLFEVPNQTPSPSANAIIHFYYILFFSTCILALVSKRNALGSVSVPMFRRAGFKGFGPECAARSEGASPPLNA